MRRQLLAAVDPSRDPRGRERKADWNQRPRDVANLARWIGKQSEQDLNWQIVNLAAKVEDFHDAPILYISGSTPLTFDGELKATPNGAIWTYEDENVRLRKLLHRRLRAG